MMERLVDIDFGETDRRNRKVIRRMDGARICRNMLEAEKAFSTVHFAIGDSYGLGRNRSRHHYDALVDRVTLIADGRSVIRNGRFTL